MEIILIVILISILSVLLAINGKLTAIDDNTNGIREMSEMSNQEKYEYSLKKDDPEGYDAHLEAKYYTEAKNRMEEDSE